jgi:hypothetical protein
MRNSIRIAAMGAALASSLAFSGAANAAASASASANAEILSTISVVKDQDMDFGQIAVNGAASLVISADESSPAACPANLVCAGARVPAKFTISGTSGVGATASVRQASVSLTGPGTNTMTLGSFSVFFPNGNTLNATGDAAVNVGGSLGVAAAQAAGLYTGSFDLDVEYQ